MLKAEIMQGTQHIERVGPEEWSRRLAGPLVGVDFESHYTSKYSVKEMGVYAYVHDPRFHAYLVSVSDGVMTCVCEPERFPWDTIDGREWVSHNRDFDRAVLRRLQITDRRLQTKAGGLAGMPRPTQWHCTAGLCAYLQYSRDLAGAVLEVFGVEVSKEQRVKSKGRHAQKQLWIENDDLAYAAGDAEWCLALWQELSGQWPAHERRLFELTSAMGERGLPMDWETVDTNIHDLNALVTSLSGALPWSPALSIPKFQAACELTGVPAPKSTAVGDTEFMQWLEAHGDSDAATWVRHMQRIRSANRTAKVLESMQARRMKGVSGHHAMVTWEREKGGRKCGDRSAFAEATADRMAYELKYFGASTGRWAGGGGLNLQNLNRTESEGVDLRKMIAAPAGKLLAVVDYSQIESRVILYLAGDQATLEMYRQNPDADAYEVHARATMNYSEVESLKDYCERTGSNLRNLAKARVLGLGFGCGPDKFIVVAKTMAGLDLTDGESRRIVREFRDSNPLIVSLWQRLNDACAACDGSDYVLPLPCTQYDGSLGRYLYYRDVVADKRGIECTVGGERVRVYGGLLAENWTQATARDVMASAWLRCAAAGFVPILSVHDELVFEVDELHARDQLRQIQQIMEQPLAWAPGLPLKADGKIMKFYSK